MMPLVRSSKWTPGAKCLWRPSSWMVALICLLLSSITFPNAAADDNTNNEYRETLSTIVPEFISKGGKIVAKENSELRLACDIRDLGEYTFMWKSKNKFLFVGNLTIQAVPGIKKDTESNGIIIEKLTEDLTGEYRCEISSNPPKSIQYLVEMPAAPVIVTTSNTEVSIQKNKPLKLDCNVKQPSPLPTTIKWIHNDKVVADNKTVFEIESIQLSDSGEIICEASNEIGSRRLAFKINVESAPELTVSDKVVHGAPGNNIEINCQAKAYPPARIEWFFGNNSRIHISAKHKIVNRDQSSTLHIHNIDPKDHDTYYCEATNSLGSEKAFFEVTGRPSKPRFTSPQVSNGGDTYTLEWTVFSQIPILSYQLKIREIDHETGQPGEWLPIQVEANKSPGPLHKQAHTFEKLSQYKSYEADVEAVNQFGTTKSDIFVFSTADLNGTSNRLLNPSSTILILISVVLYFISN